jgi:uncharacterized protein
MSDKPAAVIDTQALLDWLVFRDAAASRWSRAVLAGQLRWLACPAMRRELGHMLAHPRLARWQPDGERALAVFDRHARLLPDPVASLPSLRCRDADDQVFIDLALGERVAWLLTRDKALLALARRAGPWGTAIVRPEAWVPQDPANR